MFRDSTFENGYYQEGFLLLRFRFRLRRAGLNCLPFFLFSMTIVLPFVLYFHGLFLFICFDEHVAVHDHVM